MDCTCVVSACFMMLDAQFDICDVNVSSLLYRKKMGE